MHRTQVLISKHTLLLLTFLSVSCATQTEAPVSSRQQAKNKPVTVQNRQAVQTKPVTDQIKPKAEIKTDLSKQQIIQRGYHVVKKGDTLYSIAWNYGFDFRELAGWNNVQSPYVIYPGQIIRLKQPTKQATVSLQPGPVVSKTETTKTKPQPISKTENKSKKIRKLSLSKEKIVWQWPVKGKIIKSNLPKSKKGLDIGGRLGQDIKAAAAGDVVYSGSGLLGYGRLIIIKHNETYLSAYAHNSEIFVKEGDAVAVGQVIAKMGKTSAGQALLHFEIRKNGKPVNPVPLLPKG